MQIETVAVVGASEAGTACALPAALAGCSVRVFDGSDAALDRAFEAVRREVERRKLKIVSAESQMVPKSSVQLPEKDALQILKLVDRLEELDDVQTVHTNVDFPEDLLEKYEG